MKVQDYKRMRWTGSLYIICM